MNKATPNRSVSILALRQALVSSMMIPLEMISAADQIVRAHTGRHHPLLSVDIVAETKAMRELTGGVQLKPARSLEETPFSDLIFIPALWGNPRAALRAHPDIITWLRQCHESGAMLCAVGTGSYFLASAGLLDGRMATTHWRYFDDFDLRYPRVRLQRKRFITRDTRLYCTGSINAVRDVSLHFVEQLFDAGIANEVAHHFTHELKRSYESQLLDAEPPNIHHDEDIIKIQEWMQDHYARDVRVADVAARFNIHQRALNRRFRQAAGQTPGAYLQSVRLSRARELLKHSNLSIAETAWAVGYQDVSYFTGLFRRYHTVTPGEYRRLVRTRLFNAEQPGTHRTRSRN